MMRSGSQASEGSRSVESVESPTTAATTYTPENARFKSGGVSRGFGISSDASSPKPSTSFDVTAMCNALSGLSATANTFTPISSKQSSQLPALTTNSKLAQLTATSTPDDTFTSTPRAAGHLTGMAQSSVIQMPAFDLSHKIASKAKMSAAQPEPDATRHVIVLPSDAEYSAFVFGLLVSCYWDKPGDRNSSGMQNGIFEGAISMRPKTVTDVGSVVVFRFDSIREASAAVVTARSRLRATAPYLAQISFVDGYTYTQFDPTLDDPNEGAIMIAISAPSNGLELRTVAIEEASRFGLIHASEITDEISGCIQMKITYDSTKAANQAYQEWFKRKNGLRYPVSTSIPSSYFEFANVDLSPQTVSFHAWRSPATPVADMKQVRNDSMLFPGDGVKLHSAASNAITFAPSIFNTTDTDLRAPAATPSKRSGPVFGQPGLHFTNPWTNSPASVSPPGLPNPHRLYSSPTEHLVSKATRGSRNSNPVDPQKIIAGLDIRTTIMLRNIPNKMTAAELKQIIDRTSFGRYDFSYLRIDFANQCNVGYAFINFTKPEYIIDFLREHNGRPWGLYNSDKIAEVSYATRQGLASLIDLFQNSCVMEEIPEHRPKLWYTEVDGILCGQEKPFPPPTNLQKVRSPLSRSH